MKCTLKAYTSRDCSTEITIYPFAFCLFPLDDHRKNIRRLAESRAMFSISGASRTEH